MAPRLTPVWRDEFIRKFKNLGYDRVSGGDHEYMVKHGKSPVKVPNPHSKRGGGIGVDILRRVLRDADISRDDWEKA